MSMNMIQTFSFGVMHSFSMFTIFDSRIPRSTTRASSIASGLGRGRQLRFRHGWRRDRRRLLQDVLEGRGVPPPEGIPLQFIEAIRRADRHLHRLLELVECEMSVHLEQNDLAGSRDDRHGAV